MNIRKSAVAGMFYSANDEELQKDITSLLLSAKSTDNYNNIFGIIAPHAGYVYSGRTAAYAYNLIAGKNYKTVIIISPSHREYFKGSCIFEGESYQTPLGIVNINKSVAEKLSSGSDSIFLGVKGHRNEHAVEVHIPFLQTVLNDFTIVPVVVGDQSKQYLDELAERIASVWDESILVVASTDLSHFHEHSLADKLDSVVEHHIESKNYNLLYNDLETGKCEACGGGPVVALLKAAELKNFNKTTVLNRTDSGAVTGDLKEFVGYLSAVVYA